MSLIIAIPSKGRLKDQTEAWLADAGLRLDVAGGARGYSASLRGLPGAQVRLLSAADIAEALDSGEIHFGVTGEDLLRERGDGLETRVQLVRALGFGRADLVVAAPRSWLDVDAMADIEDVAHELVARTGRRLRVATKYLALTRAFFARHGVADYRIVESGGATEGAPAAGAAELVVDITTTGATLAANGLKVLSDGVILRSQAQLAAGLRAAWSAVALSQAERLLRIVEARAAALRSAALAWPARGDAEEAAVVSRLVAAGAQPRPNGLLVDSAAVSDAGLALAAVGLGPVTVARPEFVFDASCEPFDTLRARLI